MDDIILEMNGITKKFPGVKALDNVNFHLYKGNVMALIGENGAGKSTLMKILSGVYPKDKGKIILHEKEVNFDTPKEAQDAGISIIHQELNLVPYLSIGENIFLGREPSKKFGKVDWNKLYIESEEYLNKLGMKLNSRKLVKDLSIAEQQMVEIAKALSIDAKIIIMDEPTDSLTDKETENLFRVINELRESGKSIVYISHRLQEVFQICDSITVLRDGQFIGEELVEDITEDEIIEMMVGRKLDEQFPRIDSKLGDTVLEVKNLSNEYISNISFNLLKGEILGISGLMGSGRTELAKTIYGTIESSSGDIYIYGKKADIKSEKDAIEQGITYVSEDRKGEGLVLNLPVLENMTISSLKCFVNNFGHINKELEKKIAEEYINKLSIKTPSINQLIKNLSGGNQQKVSIAKSLMSEPKILILDEPTRGVDVGAKKEIYDLINEFKSHGMSIIMISSDIPEILGISDRVLVMHEGEISGELSIEEASQEKIMKYAVGIKEME